MKKPGLSLKYKITIFISLLILLLFMLTNYIIINHEKNILLGNLVQKGKSLINNFSLSCENAFYTGDELSIEDYITVLMKDREIRHVYILARDSTYSFNYNQELLGKKYISPEGIDTDPDKIYNIIRREKEILYQFYKPVYNLSSQGRKLFFGMSYIELTTDIIGDELSQIKKTLIYIFILLLCVGIICTFLLSRFITNPIKKLIIGINIIAKGDLQHKIKIATRDEIENLANEFNRMTTQLANYQKKLIKQKIVEQELQIARNIQSRIIPDKLMDIKKYEMFNFYESSRAIGGDYHNLIPVNGLEYLFVIADVSGKGIPASLLMVMFHTVLITLKRLHTKPLMLMKAINNIMSVFLKQGDFITSIIGLLNIKTDKIKIVAAGHEYPLQVNFKNKTFKFLKSPSLPIGLLNTADFESKLTISEYKLSKNNLIMFYTDGLRNIQKKPLNNTGLNDFFNSLLKNSSNFNDFKNLLLERIKFKKYEDDLTIMGLIRAGKK